VAVLAADAALVVFAAVFATDRRVSVASLAGTLAAAVTPALADVSVRRDSPVSASLRSPGSGLLRTA